MSSAPDSLPEFAYTGRKLGTAVLLFVLCIVGVITLEPFVFAAPGRVTLMWWDGWFDAVANVGLFVPAGFLFALTRSATATGDARRDAVRQAALFGLAASGTIELAQLFEPSRYPSPTDVATNALGATLGAWLSSRAARRLRADTPLVGRLALELPLMGLVYLLVPLCTLAALTAAGPGIEGPSIGRPRTWGLAALALFGGTLLGHVQRRHFGPSGALTVRQATLVAGGWFAVGALPALATAPRAFASGVLLAAVAAWWFGRPADDGIPFNRRFEQTALRRAAPWLAAYLALAPLTRAPGATASQPLKVDLLMQVESLAGFTVLGYVLAEAWGRLELRYRYTAWRVAAVAVLVALAAETLRRMTAPSPGWWPGVLAHVVATAYGGWIYHLQRAHVRALVAARPAAGAAPAVSAPPAATRRSPLRRSA